MRRSPALTAALTVALASLLAGCAPGALDPSSPSGSTAPSSTTGAPSTDAPVTDGPATTPTAMPTHEPIADGESTGLTCEGIFTLDDLYAFNANFTAVDATTVAVPKTMERIGELDGIICAFQHTSNDDVLFVGVAKPNEAGLAEAAAVPAFEVAGDQGVASLVRGPWWIMTSSQYFGTAADAQATLDTIVGHVG